MLPRPTGHPSVVNVLLFSDLFGTRADDNTAPRRSTIPVAHRGLKSSAHFQDINEIDTEVITTQSERETNYVHKGWSLSAISTASPWIFSRIANNNQANPSVASVTKRVTVSRLRVDMMLGDLVPVPKFELEVRSALEKQSKAEKFQALYQVFERW